MLIPTVINFLCWITNPSTQESSTHLHHSWREFFKDKDYKFYIFAKKSPFSTESNNYIKYSTFRNFEQVPILINVPDSEFNTLIEYCQFIHNSDSSNPSSISITSNGDIIQNYIYSTNHFNTKHCHSYTQTSKRNIIKSGSIHKCYYTDSIITLFGQILIQTCNITLNSASDTTHNCSLAFCKGKHTSTNQLIVLHNNTVNDFWFIDTSVNTNHNNMILFNGSFSFQTLNSYFDFCRFIHLNNLTFYQFNYTFTSSYVSVNNLIIESNTRIFIDSETSFNTNSMTTGEESVFILGDETINITNPDFNYSGNPFEGDDFSCKFKMKQPPKCKESDKLATLILRRR